MPTVLTELNKQSTKDRLGVGLPFEERIVKCLNEEHGFGLEKATSREDCVQKIDRWMTHNPFPSSIKEEGPYAAQVKLRTSARGFDALYDWREPYRGIKSLGREESRGRDDVSPFKVYICLTKPNPKTEEIEEFPNGVISVCLGRKVKQVAFAIENELMSLDEFPLNKFRTWYDCKKYPGAKANLHRDQRHGHLKIIFFFPKRLFVPGEEIIKYPYTGSWELK